MYFMDQSKIGRVLILSGGTGEGHNSASRALTEAFEELGIASEIADPLSLGGSRAGERLSEAYAAMLRRAPGLFNMLYGLGEAYNSKPLPSPVYGLCRRFAGELKDYISSGNYGAVVCTHLFAMEAMRAVREKYGCALPYYAVHTDYACIPFLAETRADVYFTATRESAGCLVRKGIAPDRVFSTGIPVRRCFSRRPEKTEARRALGLEEGGEVLLIMSGGAGCGDIAGLCREAARCPSLTTVVLTGRNAELRERLAGEFGEAVRAVGFTDNAGLYMAAADALITKPGGLSSTEAAAVNLPLVHLSVYSACETGNVDYFSSRGMSVRARDSREAVDAALALMRSREASEHMRELQRRYINPRAADDIAARVAGAA